MNVASSRLHLKAWWFVLAVHVEASFYTPNFERLSCLRWPSGSVLVWGDSSFGGNWHPVAKELHDIKKVVPTHYSFSALRFDGSVIVWGHPRNGGSTDAITKSQLVSGVRAVAATNFAFAALKTNGSVVAWGEPHSGGRMPPDEAASLRQGASSIFANEHAFVALTPYGSAVTWGAPLLGGDSSSVAPRLRGVVTVQATWGAFAALLRDGAVVTWGDDRCGGNSDSVASDLQQGVVKLFSTFKAFAALKISGAVIAWGESCCGGDTHRVAGLLTSGVQTIVSNWAAFAAIKDDHKHIVTWGSLDRGGDSTSAQHRFFVGVVDVTAVSGAFVAHLADGSEVKWGDTSTDIEHYTTRAGTRLTIATTGQASAALINARPECPTTTTTTSTSTTTTSTTTTSTTMTTTTTSTTASAMTTATPTTMVTATTTASSTTSRVAQTTAPTASTTIAGASSPSSTSKVLFSTSVTSTSSMAYSTHTALSTDAPLTTSALRSTLSYSNSVASSTTISPFLATSKTLTTATTTTVATNTTTQTVTFQHAPGGKTTTSTSLTALPVNLSASTITTSTFSVAGNVTTQHADLTTLLRGSATSTSNAVSGSTLFTTGTLGTSSSVLRTTTSVSASSTSTSAILGASTSTDFKRTVKTTTRSAPLTSANQSSDIESTTTSSSTEAIISVVVEAALLQATLALEVSGPADLAVSQAFASAQSAAFSWVLPAARMVQLISMSEHHSRRRQLSQDDVDTVRSLVVRLRFAAPDGDTAKDITSRLSSNASSAGGGFAPRFTVRLQHECNMRGMKLHVRGVKTLDISQRYGSIDLAKFLCKSAADKLARPECPDQCRWDLSWEACLEGVTTLTTTSSTSTTTTSSSATSDNETMVTTQGPLPPVSRDTDWIISDWGSCSAVCGAGERRRDVLCVAEQIGGVCSASTRPADVENCQNGCEFVGALGGSAILLACLAGCLWRLSRRRRTNNNQARNPNEDAGFKWKLGGKKKKQKDKKSRGRDDDGSEPYYSKIAGGEGDIVPYIGDNRQNPARRAGFDQVPDGDDLELSDEDNSLEDIEIDIPFDDNPIASSGNFFQIDIDGPNDGISNVRRGPARGGSGTMPFEQVPDILPLPEDDDFELNMEDTGDSLDTVTDIDAIAASFWEPSPLDGSPSARLAARHQEEPQSHPRPDSRERERSPRRPDLGTGEENRSSAASSGMFGQFMRSLGLATVAPSWLQNDANSIAPGTPTRAADLSYQDVPDHIPVPDESSDTLTQEESDTWEGRGDTSSLDITQSNTSSSMFERGVSQNRLQFDDVPDYLDVSDAGSIFSRSDSGIDDSSGTRTESASEFSRHERRGPRDGGREYTESESSHSQCTFTDFSSGQQDRSRSEYADSQYTGSECSRSEYSESQRTASSFNSRRGHNGSDGDYGDYESERGFDSVGANLHRHPPRARPGHAQAATSSAGSVKSQSSASKFGEMFSFFSAVRKRSHESMEEARPPGGDDADPATKAPKQRSFDDVRRLGQNISARQLSSRRRPVTGTLDFDQVPDTLPPVSDSEEESSIPDSSITSLAGRQPMPFEEVPDMLPVSEDGSDMESFDSRSSSLHDEDISLDFSDVPDDRHERGQDLHFSDVPRSLGVAGEDDSCYSQDSVGLPRDDRSITSSLRSRSDHGHENRSVGSSFRSRSEGGRDDRSEGSRNRSGSGRRRSDEQYDDRSVTSSIASRRNDRHDDHSVGSSVRSHQERHGGHDDDRSVASSVRSHEDGHGGHYDDRSVGSSAQSHQERRGGHYDDRSVGSSVRSHQERDGGHYDDRSVGSSYRSHPGGDGGVGLEDEPREDTGMSSLTNESSASSIEQRDLAWAKYHGKHAQQAGMDTFELEV